MRRLLNISLLAGLLLVSSLSMAQNSPSRVGLGLSLGGARGDNHGGSEIWTPYARSYLQIPLGNGVLSGQLGLGYAKLKATGIYTAETAMLDTRLVINPTTIWDMRPFIYGGFGFTKMLKGNQDPLPMIPVGFGTTIQAGDNSAFTVDINYTLSISDKLDGWTRSNSNLNVITNEKHDSYFGISLGMVFGGSAATSGSDTDEDGLTNREEKEYNTDPKKADTDGDGLTDGEEVRKYHTNPLQPDSDGDALSDGVEVVTHKSDLLNTDSDKDGLGDGVEVNQHKTSPISTDSDNDGLVDNREIQEFKTDPLKADSDNDALDDGEEVAKFGTNPSKIDSDGDGINDGEEVVKFKTDPAKADSDGDGLDDMAEIKMSKTDPIKADTDGDGLSDAAEVTRIMSDPLKADTDEDGLADGEEVNRTKTNPLLADTDGDGLKDGDEVLRTSNPSQRDSDSDGLSDDDEVTRYKTDPQKPDTDGDGLSDRDEAFSHHTNPLKIDSDDGGMNDGAEIQRKTNPLDPKDDVITFEKGKSVILHSINFEFDKATILPSSNAVLEKINEGLTESSEIKVTIIGHTDNVGSDAYNLTLSQKRADAVKTWLVNRGIAASRLESVGKGESEPMASNDTAESRAMNRRVEFAAH